jgi:CubicO group peptidase (beta-lactamase class C family)
MKRDSHVFERRFVAGLALAIAAAALAACGGSSTSGSSAGTGPAALRWPDPDWEVTAPESQAMDPAALDEARAYAFEPGRNTQGVVVVRNGAIVAEWYAPGRDASSLATSWSTAKSFGSTLVGIAIDQGAIPGVDVPLVDYYPEWAGSQREAIALRDLLEMRSGLQWDEVSNVAAFHIQAVDQLAASRSRPAAREPGVRFNYSSADSMLMSGVIEVATRRNAGDFAQEFLFGPIGMDAEWWVDGAGHTLTYCCIDTTTRDFARFGLLFARGGEWNGRQVVSREWVEAATSPAGEDLPFYGLQWWMNLQGLTVGGAPVRLFMTRGLNDQNIYVFPELDLVVVRNGVYDRIGTEAVRVGGNLITTLAPDQWNENAFLGAILRSIDPAADTSALADTARASSVVELGAAMSVRPPLLP